MKGKKPGLKKEPPYTGYPKKGVAPKKGGKKPSRKK